VLCNFCQVNEATVRLTGILEGETEPVTLMACKGCAIKAFDNEAHE